MPFAAFADLNEWADSVHAAVPVAVAGGTDPTLLSALSAAWKRGWVTPLVTGREADIRRTAEECGLSLEGLRIIDATDVASAAVKLVRTGEARLLMKGQIATPVLMKATLDPESGLRAERVICQVVLIELADRRLLLADTGICIQPNLTQKIDILRSAVAVAHSLGVLRPRVAAMAATETVAAAMPETLDAAELQRLQAAGAISGCVVRGPLSFDLAFDADAAAHKKLHDSEFGVADILLFPNLLSANLTVKAIMYTAACRFGGILAGGAVPVVFVSRADTAETRLNSLALALSVLATGGVTV